MNVLLEWCVSVRWWTRSVEPTSLREVSTSWTWWFGFFPLCSSDTRDSSPVDLAHHSTDPMTHSNAKSSQEKQWPIISGPTVTCVTGVINEDSSSDETAMDARGIPPTREKTNHSSFSRRLLDEALWRSSSLFWFICCETMFITCVFLVGFPFDSICRSDGSLDRSMFSARTEIVVRFHWVTQSRLSRIHTVNCWSPDGNRTSKVERVENVTNIQSDSFDERTKWNFSSLPSPLALSLGVILR